MINIEKVSNGYIIRAKVKGSPVNYIASSNEELLGIITTILKNNT